MNDFRKFHSVDCLGCEIRFPFIPYPQQEEYMRRIISTLDSGNSHALLESPTGSGKTLSLLTSTIGFQEAFKEAICYEWLTKKHPKYVTKRKYFVPQYLENRDLPIEEENNFANPLILEQKEMKPYTKKLLDKVEGFIPMVASVQAEKVLIRRICHFFDSLVGDSGNWYPRIYYGTRTHSQIKQLVGELKKTPYEPKMVILGSRKRYCVNAMTMTENNKDDACKELRMKKACGYHRGAKEIHDFEDLMKVSKLDKVYDIEDFVESGKKCNYCPYYVNYELVSKADIVFCPYNYLLDPRILDAMKSVKNGLKNGILILDEAHNIEDLCRSSISSTYKVQSVKECISEMQYLMKRSLIPEKTHLPLVSFLKEYQNNLMKEDLTLGEEIKEVESSTYGIKKQDIREFLKRFDLGADRVGDLYINAMEAIRLANENVEDKMEDEEEEGEDVETPPSSGGRGGKKRRIKRLSGKSCLLLEDVFIPLKFVCENAEAVEHFYVVIERILDEKTAVPERVCHFFCMNPALAIRNLAKSCYSIILTSGTLSPLGSFSTELGIEFKEVFESTHVVNVNKQVFIRTYSNFEGTKLNGTFKYVRSRQGSEYYTKLGEMIHKLSQSIPYGLLVFFPSYNFMGKCKWEWNAVGRGSQRGRNNKKGSILSRLKENKLTFFEPSASEGAETFKKLVVKYKQHIKNCESGKYLNAKKKKGRNGAIFFGVSRGKLSEGISFKDNESRGVIIISIPFPSLRDFAISLKKKWNNEAKHNSMRKSIHNRLLMDGSGWYKLQAYRAVNQALGRCIRHRMDYGAIFLLDERFSKARISFPRWIRSAVMSRHKYNENEEKQLQTFFKEIKNVIRREKKDQEIKVEMAMRQKKEKMEISKKNQYFPPEQQHNRMNYTSYSGNRNNRSNPSPPLPPMSQQVNNNNYNNNQFQPACTLPYQASQSFGGMAGKVGGNTSNRSNRSNSGINSQKPSIYEKYNFSMPPQQQQQPPPQRKTVTTGFFGGATISRTVQSTSVNYNNNSSSSHSSNQGVYGRNNYIYRNNDRNNNNQSRTNSNYGDSFSGDNNNNNNQGNFKDFSMLMNDQPRKQKNHQQVDPEATQTFSPFMSRIKKEKDNNDDVTIIPPPHQNSEDNKKRKRRNDDDNSPSIKTQESSSSSSDIYDDENEENKKKKKMSAKEKNKLSRRFSFVPSSSSNTDISSQKKRKSTSTSSKDSGDSSSSSSSSSSDEEMDDFFNNIIIQPPPSSKRKKKSSKTVIIIKDEEEEEGDDDADSSSSNLFSSGDEQQERKKSKKKKKRKKKKMNRISLVGSSSSKQLDQFRYDSSRNKVKVENNNNHVPPPPPPTTTREYDTLQQQQQPYHSNHQPQQQQMVMDLFHQPDRITLLICRKCKNRLDDQANTKFIQKRTIIIPQASKPFLFRFHKLMTTTSSNNNKIIEIEETSRKFLCNITNEIDNIEDLDPEIVSIRKEENNHISVVIHNQMRFVEPLLEEEQGERMIKSVEFKSKLDGVVYRLLFCKSCSNPVGLEVVMGNMDNVSSIGKLYVIRNEDVRKRKLPNSGSVFNFPPVKNNRRRSDLGSDKKRRRIMKK